MKLVEVVRYGMDYPLELANGDSYDSIVNVYDGFEAYGTVSDLKLIKSFGFINTDPSVDKKNGVLKEGDYYFITGLHRGKYKALLVFQEANKENLSKIKTPNDLTAEERTLPSNRLNKTSNDMFLRGVNMHKGGLEWDWSEGCVTMATSALLKDTYTEFINLFKDNEVGAFKLTIKV